MFADNPNRLEAVFVQRDTNNSRYDQINISGSDLIVYLDENGKINADKASVWAAKYNIGVLTGSLATSSWASMSISASYALSASYTNTPVTIRTTSPTGSAGNTGSLIYDTVSNFLFIYTGTQWKSSSFF